MARLKLTVPDNCICILAIPVRITDINYGNHLGNDALVGIIHEARVQWLNRQGYSELNIEGTSLIMSDLAVEYSRESFYGDQLEIKIAAGEITRVSFELFYSVSTVRDGKLVHIANAKTGMVCYDYTAKKVTAVPEKFIAILTAG